MLQFLGDYEVTLDSKGRFLLPSAIKKELTGETAGQFVINKGMEPCLTLWPKQSWDPVYARLNSLNDFEPKVRYFKYMFLDGVQAVDADSAGRILLTKTLIDYAQLDKDLILKASGDKIQVWDKNVFRKFIESLSQAADTYSELARDVMGNGITGVQLPLR
jgi:MraZ protein